MYKVSDWDCSREMKMKMKQNGLVKEWLKFSKADEQASVKPSKWRRWSAARRETHQERLWSHRKHKGEGQVQVQAGTGQVDTTELGSAEQASRQVRAAR